MFRAIKQLIDQLSTRDRAIICALLAMMLVSAGLELLGIGLIMPVIALLSKPELIQHNAYLSKLNSIIKPSSDSDFIIILSVTLIAVFIGKNLFLMLQHYLQSRFTFSKGAQLTSRLFERYVKAPYDYHLEQNSGHLMGNLNVGVSLCFGVLMPAMILFTEILVVVAVFTMLLLISPKVTLSIAGAICILSLVVYYPLRKHNHLLGKAMFIQNQEVNKYALQGLMAFKESKIRNSEEYFIEQFATHQYLRNRAGAGMLFMGNIPRFLIEMTVVCLGLGALISLLVLEYTTGTILMTLSLFAISLVRMMPSMSRIQYSLTQIRQHAHCLTTLLNDLHLKTEQCSEEIADITFAASIKLENITFDYGSTDSGGFVVPPSGGSSTTSHNETNDATCAAALPNETDENSAKRRTLISDYSLEIPKNSSVAFVGPTGCGKTTLVDIILGLLKPCTGKVTVDGVDIEKNIRKWRQKIGYVPQQIFLLDDTIANNVAFGIPEGKISLERVRECLQTAQIQDFVTSLPQKEATLVGENGVRLSGGQRQRIGIARALYHNPEVLVLDEATSALDNDTEKAFVDALKTLHGKLTIIMVAHRLTTVENCDKIVKLD